MRWLAQRAEYTHQLAILLVITSVVISQCLGVFLLPIPGPIAWGIGGIILVGGAVMYLHWGRLWRAEYEGQLVTDGIYRYIRHPHYSSTIILTLGLSLLLRSWLALVFVALSVPAIWWGAREEERELVEIYGEVYREYLKRVTRRFIPGVF